MKDPNVELMRWLKENHPEALKYCIKMIKDNDEYDMMDACDAVDSGIYSYWCNHVEIE